MDQLVKKTIAFMLDIVNLPGLFGNIGKVMHHFIQLNGRPMGALCHLIEQFIIIGLFFTAKFHILSPLPFTFFIPLFPCTKQTTDKTSSKSQKIARNSFAIKNPIRPHPGNVRTQA